MSQTNYVEIVAIHAHKLFKNKGMRYIKNEKLMKVLDKYHYMPMTKVNVFLGHVRVYLEERYRYTVCSVGQAMCNPYIIIKGKKVKAGFAKNDPQDRTQCRLCLPGGKENNMSGLLFAVDKEGDLLNGVVEEWLIKYTDQGLSEVGLNLSRIQTGANDKCIDLEIVTERLQRTAPEKLVLMQDILNGDNVKFMSMKIAEEVVGLVLNDERVKSKLEANDGNN